MLFRSEHKELSAERKELSAERKELGAEGKALSAEGKVLDAEGKVRPFELDEPCAARAVPLTTQTVRHSKLQRPGTARYTPAL